MLRIPKRWSWVLWKDPEAWNGAYRKTKLWDLIRNSSDHVFTQYMVAETAAAGTILCISQKHLGVLTSTTYKYRHWNNWFIFFLSLTINAMNGSFGLFALLRTSPWLLFYIPAGHFPCHEESLPSDKWGWSFIDRITHPAVVAAGIFQGWVALAQKWPGEFPKMFSSLNLGLIPSAIQGDLPNAAEWRDGWI